MTSPRDQKLSTLPDALSLIQDGQTIAFTGFGGSAHAEALSKGLGEYFQEHSARVTSLFCTVPARATGATKDSNTSLTKVCCAASSAGITQHAAASESW